MIDIKKRANILIEALPYIKEYNEKIVVIKYGGNAMIDDNIKKSVLNDLVLLKLIGVKIILVHGGGPEISKDLDKINKKSEFINGLRVTDKETMEVVLKVLAGKLNKEIVGLINEAGGKAVGLSGVDGNLIEATKICDELEFVGDVNNINPELIYDLIDKDYIPVISSIGYDNKNNFYNINADTVASKVAGVLKAHSLFIMTDTKGVLRNKDDLSSLIPVINVSEIKELMKEKIIQGGMIPKVQCAEEAIRRGVQKVFILDGRVEHSILIEVLTNEGIGTMFK